MNTTHIDLLLAATVGLLYVLYVFVRVLSLRISWVFRLLIAVPVFFFPIVGAAFVHLVIYVFARQPRDVRFMGAYALVGSVGALLAYGLTFFHIEAHDAYGISFIFLGMLAFPALGSFVLIVGSELGNGRILGLLSEIPKWALLLAALIVVTAVIHLGLYGTLSEDGVPRARSGSYYLEINDRPIRKLTEQEYYAFSGHFVRGVSSLLLAFYLVPALFFLLRSPGMPGEAEGKTPAATASPRRLDRR